MEYFKVKINIVKTDQEYTHICKWKAYALYKTKWWMPWVNAGLFESAEGPEPKYSYSGTKFGGKFKEEYLEKLHDAAYCHAIIHYRKSLVGEENPYVKNYDLSIVEDFVKGRYSEIKD